MADHPDVYADGVTITINPVGVAITFTRTTPAVPNVTDSAGTEIAATIRLARPVAEGVRDLLQQALSQDVTQTRTIAN